VARVQIAVLKRGGDYFFDPVSGSWYSKDDDHIVQCISAEGQATTLKCADSDMQVELHVRALIIMWGGAGGEEHRSCDSFIGPRDERLCKCDMYGHKEAPI
jgi:hypothetical protein